MKTGHLLPRLPSPEPIGWVRLSARGGQGCIQQPGGAHHQHWGVGGGPVLSGPQRLVLWRQWPSEGSGGYLCLPQPKGLAGFGGLCTPGCGEAAKAGIHTG